MISDWSSSLKSDLSKLSVLAQKNKPSEKVELKEGERRHVTILFLDIQGFTAMSEKLDPEDVQLIIDQSFKILTSEIERHHGVIDKYEGDRLMALFGSRNSTEQDCERALRAALCMKEKFLLINQILKEKNIEVGIRIGVNSGLVVTGKIGKGREQDFTVMGDAVNLASRLESNAPPNEIMISQEVKKIVEDKFIFEDLGEISVKGKTEPILVFAVKKVQEKKIERWERSLLARRTKFVGREKEMNALLSLVKTITQKPQMGLIRLSAIGGSGKSRLIFEMCHKIKSLLNCEVVKGAAFASNPAPYAMISDLVKSIFEHPQFESVKRNLQSKTHFDKFFPVLEFLADSSKADERISQWDPATLKLEIHLSVKTLIKTMMQSDVFWVIHLDDMQWADANALETLDFLFTQLEKNKTILFVLGFRPEYVHSLKFEGPQIEIQLQPLGEAECREILIHAFEGLVFSKEDEALMIGRAGGYPFFMEEMVQTLIDEEVVILKDKQWVKHKNIDPQTLPDSIERMIVGRVDRLEAHEKQVLMACATLGDEAPLAVAINLVKKLNVTDYDWLSVLILKGFLTQPSDGKVKKIKFKHALIQEVVYRMILNHNKAILHELSAQELELYHGAQSNEKSIALFYHYAQTKNAQKIKQYGLLALEEHVWSSSAKAGLVVVDQLQNLFKDEMDADFEAKLLEDAFKFYDFLGARQDQLKTIEAFERLIESHPSDFLKAKLGQHKSVYFCALGKFKEGFEEAEKGLVYLKTHPNPNVQMELLKMQGIAQYNQGHYDQAKTFYEQGLTLANALNDPNAKISFFNALGLVKYNSGQPKEALVDYTEAFKLTQALGQVRGEANALGNQGLVYWNMGEYSKALEYLGQSHQMFVDIGFKKGQAVTLGNLGVIHHKLGLYAKAIEMYEKALSLRTEIGDEAGLGYDQVNLGSAYTQLGDFDKALGFLTQAETIARKVESKYLLTESLNCYAIICRKLGETNPSQLNLAFEKASEALECAKTHRLIPATIKALSNLSRIWWLKGDAKKALALSFEAINFLKQHEQSVEGSEEETHVNHYFLLTESNQSEQAQIILEKMIRLIELRLTKIDNPKHRLSFTQEVRHNRYAIAEWKKRNPSWNP